MYEIYNTGSKRALEIKLDLCYAPHPPHQGAGNRVRGGLALPSGKNHGMTTLRNTLAALEGCE